MFKSQSEFEAYRIKCEERVNSAKVRILVCMGATCLMNGAKHIAAKFRELAGYNRDITVEYITEETECGADVIRTGCQGFCKLAPLVRIIKGDKMIQYVRVKRMDCEEIFEKTVLGDELIERLLYTEDGKSYPEAHEIPFFKDQTRNLLHDMANVDVGLVHDYIGFGGFKAFEKALFTMTPEDIVKTIEDSKLKGRGGGGFLTGFKWRSVMDQPKGQKYIVCNADEGDPGTFIDGAIMDGSPFQMIEGMMIAGLAVGASEGYVYVRAEYPISMKRLNEAIDSLTEIGLLGDNILGTDFSFRMYVYSGMGAFVCGEESSLVASLEGKRGFPSIKPPFLTTKGYMGKPTVLNNVETFDNVPHIIERGAQWFNSIGTPECPGTKIYALSGAVARTGLVEVPMGTTLRDIIFKLGNGMKEGSTFKAALVGGPTGRCLVERHLDIPFDFVTAAQNDAIVGSGGIIVLDQTTNMVELSKFLMKYSVNESCGKCTPCRIGTTRMYEILDRLCKHEAKEEDLVKLKETGEFVLVRALCGLGKSTPLMVLNTLEDFPEEYKACLVSKESK